ncbi:MAG: phosphoribosylaminoimidazolesuccinocarboxamide synthase [Thermoplasmata archaeon]|nr:MAG: phosphoribosylaminoimidazolesuccinocarboxamide synthase [Thermoplasmata archaeon]
MKLYRRGKVKDVYEESQDTLVFHFSDRISVFDKVISTPIPNKGAVLCLSASHWFSVANDMGIPNHFLGLLSPSRMRVKRFKVIMDYSEIRGEKNYVIPLEFIARYYVAGSLYDRLKRGVIDAKALGFRSNSVPEYGEELPEPYFEITTKFEHYDRVVTMEEAMEVSCLNKEQIDEIFETIMAIDERIKHDVAKRRLIHVDGKKEFALGNDGEIVLIDTFGTPDEDRWWDADAYDEGKYVELSKEAVRQYYKKISYYDELKRAREKGMEEPPIPPLPENIAKEISRLYVTMYFRITGKDFYQSIEELTA